MAGFFSTLRRIYLSLYNWAVFVGWSEVLYLAVKTLSESGHEHVYNAVERPLQLAQTAAVLEILHGLTQTHILVSSLVISWSITEIIRYSFFGMKEALGFAPSWLLWLRYSTFLLLYPTGISSEVGLMYVALPYIKISEKYCIRMPNKWNFSFDYFYLLILVALICTHICWARGRKLYQNQKGNRTAFGSSESFT
ncbi:Protein-tyrosine phosphatase-like, PTPLA, partial [Dillenia turbinata]